MYEEPPKPDKVAPARAWRKTIRAFLTGLVHISDDEGLQRAARDQEIKDGLAKMEDYLGDPKLPEDGYPSDYPDLPPYKQPGPDDRPEGPPPSPNPNEQ